MGLFDRFRRPAPPPVPAAPPAPAEPVWLPTPPLAAALQVGAILCGQADAPEVIAVHQAIETALMKTFGDQVPLAWTRMPAAPLALVRVYWVDSERGPYFHYVGWGLTEMGPKASPNAEVSGYGIELTMKVRAFEAERVATAPRAQLAPLWPVELLTRLSAGVQRSGRPYGHDHWVQAGEKGFGPENVRHLAFAFDESFEAVATPNGAFRFLQLYRIDDAELERCKQADAARRSSEVLPARRAIDPRLVVDRTVPR